MGKDTIIVLRDGTQLKLTPKALKFIDELKEFFAERGITEEEIPLYLAELSRRERARKL
ncbi:unnamed protein product [marine sediment metagenome]|uniref:Uncharacterized protein n=1 Tax=marine sediment metagenome TaxID=412755 RepID=X1EWZ7_9ZZZZ